MPETATKVGPADNGRRMTLAEFDTAEGQPGYRYELSRGIVRVYELPDVRHLAQVNVIRLQIAVHEVTHPDDISAVGGTGECKFLITEAESERHPDVAVYKSPPAGEKDLWATWIPEIAVEIVSPGSEQRDYVEKRQEYLLFGVLEYWVVDADRQEVLALRRRGGRWTERVVRPPEAYTTKLLPGFELNCAAVFEAARAAGGS